jgi:hypothetical protein
MTIRENNSARATSAVTASAKVDLRVHVTSRNGEEPRKRHAVPTIKRIFFEARAKGMRFVTITEHNSMTSSLILKHLWPEDSFTGVEVTTLFPEDGGRAH